MTVNKLLTVDGIRLLITIIVLFCYGTYSINQNQIFTFVGLALLILLFIQGSAIDDFYVIVALLPFTGLVIISNKAVLFIVLSIAILKLLLSLKHRVKINKTIIISVIVFLAIEILNDIFSVKIGSLLDIIAIVFYFCCFIVFANLKKYNHQKTTQYFCISVGIAVFFVFLASGGSLSSFIQSSSNGDILRFGDENRNLGGAMGVPIYALLITTFLLGFIINNKLTFKTKVALYSIILLSIFIGFLSVSRVYLLGLAAVFLCLILSLPTKKFSTIIKWFLFLFCMVMVASYYNPEVIINIVDKLNTRLSYDDISTGRFAIYKSCLEYLSKHPWALLFGLGAKNYVQFGLKEGYLFGAMAHNAYLDALMSWGIVGVTAYFTLLVFFFKKCMKTATDREIDFIKLMPAITLGVCYLTSGSFYYLKTYIYILIVILHIFFVKKNSNKSKI